MLNAFVLLTPETLEEAIKLYAEHDACKVLAGGTDVFVEMHEGKEYPILMDIKQLKELKGLSWSDDKGLCIGALTTYAELERSEVVRKLYPALIDGVTKTGSVQVRTRATLAGNLVTASPAGDSLGALLVYDATLRIQGLEGIREVPVAEFFTGYKKTLLKYGELITHILLPATLPNTGSAYIKVTRRKAMDIGVLGTGVRIVCNEEGVCTLARISLLAAAPTAIRAYEAEQYMIGKRITEEVMMYAGELAYNIAHPKTWRTNEEYSRDMFKVYVPRTIAAAFERMKKGAQ
ncbi:MAG: FAD binding domain-containing protein [Clostridia bacterium]